MWVGEGNGAYGQLVFTVYCSEAWMSFVRPDGVLLRTGRLEGVLLVIVTFRNDSSRVAIYATVSTKVVMKQYL